MHVYIAKNLTFALALAAGAVFAAGDFEIEWDKPVDLGPGGYARIHRLADGRLMAAYAKGGEIVARFYVRGTGGRFGAWGECVTVARGFVATNGCFQVWTKELGVGSGGVGELVWVDVEAEGVMPQVGVEYTFRFAFDYAAKTYGVEVQTATGFTRLREENPVNPVNPVQNFPSPHPRLRFQVCASPATAF